MNRRPLRAVPALLLVAALFQPGTALAQPGTAVARADCTTAGAADFNGDGIDDAVAGDPFADVQGTEGAGAVQVLLGGKEPAGSASVSSKGGRPGAGGFIELRRPDAAAGDGFGWSVRTAHVNGDKCLDVIVGAPYADVQGVKDAGAAYVFYGTPAGDPKVVPLYPDPEAEAHFGWSLAAAELPASQAGGALVAVGEPHADRDNATDSGAVLLYEVNDTAKPATTITQDSEGVIGNSEVRDMYGWSLALGHLGGKPDQLDLAVGAPYENDDGTGRQVASGKIDSGMVAVVFDVLTAEGTYTSKKWDPRQAATEVPEKSGDRFGYALDYAEWKGDGYLVASAPLADAGAQDSGLVQLFVRKGDGEVVPLRTFRLGVGQFKGVSPAKGARIGWSLAFWNPVDVLALAIGSPYETFQRGPKESGLVRQVDVALAEGSDLVTGTSAVAYEHYGWSVTDVGGANALTPGDRLLVGVPDRPTGGAVAVLDGGRPTYYGPPKAAGNASADFGFSVAG